MAGRDTGGLLCGFLSLASFTNSINCAQIFNATTKAFAAVGTLNHAREASVPVALPNNKVLVVGGENCFETTFGTCDGSQCDALQTAELYDQTTQTFTVAGSGSGGMMTAARSFPSATLIKGCSCPLDGQVLIVGGQTGSRLRRRLPARARRPGR